VSVSVAYGRVLLVSSECEQRSETPGEIFVRSRKRPQPRQAEPRITRQKFSLWKRACGPQKSAIAVKSGRQV
jgi:hypothetical protein